MADDRRRTQPITSAAPVTEHEASRRDHVDDGRYEEVERVEDTVPYLPLTSYPVQIVITDVRRAVPHVYPDEILEDEAWV